MKSLSLILLLLIWPGTASAEDLQVLSSEFTQDVTVFDAQGRPLPQTLIDPTALPGLAGHRYSLGRGRDLLIVSNIEIPREQGFDEMAAVVQRFVSFGEEQSGRRIDRGVLLYVLEMNPLPRSYRFRVKLDHPSPWCEVRLVLVPPGAVLSGPRAPSRLQDMLYDTLPHELGHDLVDAEPTVVPDLRGQPSRHTRWFCEGVCEWLAKEFARLENPDYHARALAERKVGAVLTDPDICQGVFGWEQFNDNPPSLESDLYGAAYLLMASWTQRMPLADILASATRRGGQLGGTELLQLLSDTARLGPIELMVEARRLGGRLARSLDSHGQAM